MCDAKDAEKIIAEIKAKTQKVHDELMSKFDLVHVSLEQVNSNGTQPKNI